jgi:tetratricopeptide (TPR) repeat protein
MKANGRIREGFMKVLMLLIMSAILPYAIAQQSGNSETGTANQGTATAQPSRTTIFSVPSVTPSTSSTDSSDRPELIFISGEVSMDDGAPPPLGAVIERECGGTSIREAVVNPSGRFGFQIADKNRLNNIFPDASQTLNQDPIERDSPLTNPNIPVDIANKLTAPLFTKIMGCELKAQLAGFRSTAVRLGVVPRTGIIEVGTIVLYPVSRVKGTMVSASSLLAPKAAKKALDNAAKASKRKDIGETEKYIKSALEIYPDYAQAWLEIGRIYEERKLVADARNAYKKAIAIDKLFVSPYISLAKLEANEGNWKESTDISDQALALDPINLPEGYYLNALAYYNLNKLDLAEKSVRQGLRMDLENRIPSLNIVLADILAKKKDIAGSIAALKMYLKIWPDAPDVARIRTRIQEDEKMAKVQSVNAHPQ